MLQRAVDGQVRFALSHTDQDSTSNPVQSLNSELEDRT
jgi:hypothetical protein